MNNMRAGKFLLTVLVGCAGLVFLPAGANADEGDPPSQVARISDLNGSVSFQAGGAGEWSNAVLNRPMTIGDRIWTDAGARAELQAGALSIHLNGGTALSFLNLDDQTIQMRMAEGQINFRVRELRSEELYEVDAPNLAFTVTRAGTFRVDVNEAGDVTVVTVFSGEGEVTAGGQSYELHDGERGEFRGVENIEFSSDRAPEADPFDRWAMDRDSRGENSETSRYVSRDVIGYEDLDRNGTWRDAPDYGPVWYPSQVYPGWAPYRYGHWVWISPWGWTWVDDASWGFAPFHYGRWAFIGGSWGWCPGPFFVRPVFSPAFVFFVGGRHFRSGFGFGGPVAWCPLGFGEPFFPWFRSSRTFITRINVSNTRIRNVNILHTSNARNFNFVHARTANAVTAVSQRTFVNGEAVGRANVRVTPDMMRKAEFSNRAEATPTRQSVLGASAGGRVSTPPAGIQSRAVVARATPAPAAKDLPVRSANLRARGPARATVNAPSGGSAGNQPGGRTNAGSQQGTMNTNHSADRPPGARGGASSAAGGQSQSNVGRGSSGNSSANSAVSPRSTDRYKPPSGSNEPPRNSSRAESPRYSPPPAQSNTPSRSYEAPRNSTRAESPRYSPPPARSNTPSRSYSAPQRSNPAPSRSYSAPRGGSSGGSSRGSSGGSSRGSSGGSSHGSSGGSSHGSSGGSSRGSSGSHSGRH
jgi:hypothetical protein